MLAISPIMIGKAYSVEYTGQVSNTGNNVQSEYITLTLFTKNGNNYTPMTNEVLESPTLNYVEVTEVIDDETVTNRYLDGTYHIIKDSSNIHVCLSGPKGYVLNESIMTMRMFIEGREYGPEDGVKLSLTTMYYDEVEVSGKTEEVLIPTTNLEMDKKYLIKATAVFNDFEIAFVNEKQIDIEFRLECDDIAISAQYTEGSKTHTLALFKPTNIESLVTDINESIDPNSNLTAVPDGDEIFITGGDDDHGMTPTGWGGSFDTSFVLPMGMEFYIHLTFKNDTELNNIPFIGNIDFGDTVINVKCTIGDETSEKYYNYTLDKNTKKNDIYLGRGNGHDMIEIHNPPSEGEQTFISNDETITVHIDGEEAGYDFDLWGASLTKKGQITFSIVPIFPSEDTI